MEWNTAADRFIEALASSDPTPGGGAGAAMAGAMGCALALMAIGTTLKQKSTQPDTKGLLTQSSKRLHSLNTELKTLIQKDADAYAAYLVAKKLPKEDAHRPQVLQDALWFAATVPADTATTAAHCLREIDKIKGIISPVIHSDVLCAEHLLKASIRCAVENIRANQLYLTNEERKETLEKQIISLLKLC